MKPQGSFISLFDLFKIGIGPSSSHTVGPMKAARQFAEGLQTTKNREKTRRLEVTLYGSLALTGLGHGTDRALIAGLSGERPETINPDALEPLVQGVRQQKKLKLLGLHEVAFDPTQDFKWLRTQNLPQHPNAMRFEAFEAGNKILSSRTFYSLGGGFLAEEGVAPNLSTQGQEIPYPFKTAAELLSIGERHQMAISEIMLANEKTFRTEDQIREGLQRIHQALRSCVERGLKTTGTLPGGMKIRRRAPELYARLSAASPLQDPLAILDWVNVFAIAVNEENASFGRVVTAPTNGAAGIIPAVLEYYLRFVKGADAAGADRFLLAAAAIGTLYKLNASISGAEVGCQGEVGVASSMAAGALAQVMGGSNAQIENAAEIAMEHHLGMTCDPVGGLVQIPCIERNAMGAVKAINAARIALHGNGEHAISLDRVIQTMWETGQDMSTKYKETSRGGLAVNVPEC